MTKNELEFVHKQLERKKRKLGKKERAKEEEKKTTQSNKLWTTLEQKNGRCSHIDGRIDPSSFGWF